MVNKKLFVYEFHELLRSVIIFHNLNTVYKIKSIHLMTKNLLLNEHLSYLDSNSVLSISTLYMIQNVLIQNISKLDNLLYEFMLLTSNHFLLFLT